MDTPPWGRDAEFAELPFPADIAAVPEVGMEAEVTFGWFIAEVGGPNPIAGDFFQGWKPLPTAASAKGGGLFELSLLHWAASIARGVPRSPGCSYKVKKKNKIEWLDVQQTKQ